MKPQLLNIVRNPQPFDLGEQASLIATPLGREFEISFFDIGESNTGARSEWWSRWLALRHRLRADRIDLVHAWGDDAAAWTRFAVWGSPSLARRLVVTTEYSTAIPNRLARTGWAISRRLGESGEPIRVGSAARQPAAESTSAPATHAEHQFAYCTKSPIAKAWPAFTGGDWEGGRGRFVIGCVCHLEARSGVKHLLWALELLRFLYVQVHLVMSGEGSQHRELRRYVRQLKLEDRVTWLPAGGMTRERLGQLDFYWQAERGAAASALIAAAAQGIPAVAPRSAGTEQLARATPRLRLVDWGARDDLAKSTRELFESLRQTSASTPTGPMVPDAINDYSADTIADCYMEVYRAVLDRAGD